MVDKRTILVVFAFILSLVSYSLPWAQGNGRVFTGWQCTVPLGFPYLMGLILSGLSLVIPRRRMILNILAGVFVILGTVGIISLVTVGGLIAEIIGERMDLAYGSGLGFLSGLTLIIVGVLQRTAFEKEQRVGHELAEAGVSQKPYIKYCVYCGSEMFSDGIYCPSCGRQQPQPSE
ncbi:MAG: hypothetical protein QXR65_05010 [Candidatus Bathyarchaeia archaeon]